MHASPLHPSRQPGFSAAAVRKAAAFTAAFTMIGLIAAMRSSAPAETLMPSLLLYVCVLVNTYYSVRIFATIQHRDDVRQAVVDVLLGILYLGMALCLGKPVLLPLVVAAMFAVATLKYALLLGVAPYPALLRHKIIIDCLGTLAALGALALALFWSPEGALWIWAIGFALAQTDVFLLRPLYVFHEADVRI